MTEHAFVTAVSLSTRHSFSKSPQLRITLMEGLGVEGDAHAGVLVKHRSRVARDPSQPNLRQVHLIHSELHDELRIAGFDVGAGDMGENITTRGVDLLALPVDTLLLIGETAVVRVTGLRNPCSQLDRFADGLMAAVLAHGHDGELIRKAGIMGVVATGGPVGPDDRISVAYPARPHRWLAPV